MINCERYIPLDKDLNTPEKLHQWMGFWLHEEICKADFHSQNQVIICEANSM